MAATGPDSVLALPCSRLEVPPVSEEPLHILIVEDSPTDMKLVVQALRRMARSFDYERIENEAAMRAALSAQTWDVILSDWSLPTFSGLGALAVARELGLDIPFILVSGTIGEEVAVEAIRAGAHDYVLKDRLTRLVPSVERELRESEARRQRRRAEEALRISEFRFRRLADSGIVGIAIADVLGNVHEANEAYLDMLGYSREEMISGGARWPDMTPAEWQASDATAVESLRKDGVSPIREKEYLRKDGTRVPVLVGAAMLDEPMYITFAADLTQRKRVEKALAISEEQLRQAQKMEAVGQLAGGVAHDFSNLLSVILTCSELLLADLNEVDPSREYADEIQKAGVRAAEVTKQLLMFSRQQMLEPQVLDLNALVANMDRLLRRLVRENVELITVTGSCLGNVKADQGSVEQMVMNLVVNARDAMSAGGKITIETTNVTLDADQERTPVGSKAGPYVMLAITDTGVGMNAATQARIFEPFFTTKERGKGTGLGLSTVFGIVQQCGGSIALRSELGRGTTFTVYLPRVNEAVAVTQAVVAASMAPGSETILVVEDEDHVRAAVRVILMRAGYRVLEARGGDDALLVAEKCRDHIHLLLTDVIMPGMNGPELAERMVVLRPDLRVLCMSGYTDVGIAGSGALASEFAYLQKPLTAEALTRKVRAVLDAPVRVLGLDLQPPVTVLGIRAG